jgi:hypothetical protein
MAKSRTLQNLPEARLEEIRALRQGLPVGIFQSLQKNHLRSCVSLS